MESIDIFKPKSKNEIIYNIVNNEHLGFFNRHKGFLQIVLLNKDFNSLTKCIVLLRTHIEHIDIQVYDYLHYLSVGPFSKYTLERFLNLLYASKLVQSNKDYKITKQFLLTKKDSNYFIKRKDKREDVF